MPPTTPYTNDLGHREPLTAMRDTADRIRALVTQWSPAQFERSYAPGKWTARQILIHLAQTELALGNRARMALSTPDYVAQAFDQDLWIGRDAALGGREALEAFHAMSTMNRAMFASLTDADRAVALSHPEYGALTVNWIIHQIAGHQIHHLKQLETISERPQQARTS
jgi:DinB superfamily